MNKYTFFWKIWLAISYLYTKVFFKSARLIRLPFDIRNKQFIRFGKNLTTGIFCRFEAYPQDINSKTIFIGDDVEINDYVHISGGQKVVIGNKVLIASKVFISDINHGNYKGIIHDNPLIPPKERKLSMSPVLIGDNVWIGEGVCIMPGVTIGEGSIIGASSVVTRNIPSYSIAVGSPCKVIKVFDFTSNKWGPFKA